ncbi:TonB family protein [Marinobacter sp.]|uniref:TonB family protein n=1 Tax=Marinobacter sp. TaxID=50741 RepID=UPI0034A48C1E
MQDPGSTASPPAQYRIALAISIALMLHTLVLSSLPLMFDRDDRATSSLTFELVPPGSAPTQQSPARPVEHASEPSVPEPAQKTPDMVRTEAQARTQTAAAEAESKTARPADTPSSSQSQTASLKSAPVAEGSPTNAHPEEPAAEVTRITETPEQTDDYIVRLASEIAGELKRSRIRALRGLKQSVTMEIELHLLEGGTLTRAVVAQSSGVEEIDGAAYRAALAASPYPELPDDHNGKRYRVELVFSPERITGS